jgi:hypothetical protein
MSGIDEASAGEAPAVLRPGQGLVLTARGSVMAFKAVAEQTDGDFSLMERTLPARGRRPPGRGTAESGTGTGSDGAVRHEPRLTRGTIVGQREGGPPMAILTEDMKRLVREQGLGFYATLCEDGSPNLSPKGTTRLGRRSPLLR